MKISKKLRFRDYLLIGSTMLSLLFSYSKANAQAGPWPAEDKRDSFVNNLVSKTYPHKTQRYRELRPEELESFSTIAVNPRIRYNNKKGYAIVPGVQYKNNSPKNYPKNKESKLINIVTIPESKYIPQEESPKIIGAIHFAGTTFGLPYSLFDALFYAKYQDEKVWGPRVPIHFVIENARNDYELDALGNMMEVYGGSKIFEIIYEKAFNLKKPASS